MSGQDRTIIIVEDDLDFTAADFMLAWNVEQSDSDLPMALLLEKGRTFDAGLMSVVGDVANVLQIIGFIGVPTVAIMVQKLVEKRAASQSTEDEEPAPPGLQIDETIIDLDQDGKIQRITIRRVAS